MTATINSWVAIQARIAERQREYRNSDCGPADLIFGSRKSPTWLRHA